MELGLDGLQIREDIRVVKLEIVEDRGARVVVDKLGAFVEKCGVVFVGLDHKERALATWLLSRCTGQTCRQTKVLRDTTNQKTRRQTGIFKNPGQHRGGGGFAVRAGYRQHPLVVQHLLGQPLRAGDVWQAAIEDFLHQRIATCDHVADHKHIRFQFKLLRAEALNQLDTLRFQLGAHRRINVGIAASHTKTCLFGDDGNAAHESTANTKNMNVHDQPEIKAHQRVPRRRHANIERNYPAKAAIRNYNSSRAARLP